MPDKPPLSGTRLPPPGPAPPGVLPRRHIGKRFFPLFRNAFALRKEIPTWQMAFAAVCCIAVCYGLWWFVTRDVVRGDTTERLLSHYTLPSPAETFASFPSLWSDRYLTVNTVVTLKRVLLGFGLAA